MCRAADDHAHLQVRLASMLNTSSWESANRGRLR